MTPFRAVLMFFIVALTAMSPVLGQGVSQLGGSPALASVAESPGLVAAAGGDDNENDGGDDNENDDDNGNGDDDGNGNDGDDDGGNGNGVGAISAAGPAPLTGPGAPAGTGSECARAGQQTDVVSTDGKIRVRVFPTMSNDVRITILSPVLPTSVPATPGTRVDGLTFQLIAEYCAGGALATLPAEVNLGISYTDADAAGLNEASFTIARLDPVDNLWKPTAKQAADPPANYTSATIMDMGYYVVHTQ